MTPIIPKSQMTEEDIKLQFITPAITAKWNSNRITMETKITDGRVNIRGNLVFREKPKNSSFAEKRDIENGFRERGLRLNTWIAQQENWGLPQLEERNSILMARALKIWSYPQTEFKPAEKQMDSYTLDDDADLGGRIIAKFGYKNTEQPVGSWIEMMEQVLKMLHNDDK